jgi:hypothetical protein
VRGRLLPCGEEAIAVGSLLEELARREAAARAGVEPVRGRAKVALAQGVCCCD